MSKAEEMAEKAYPYNGDYRGQGDSNSKLREVYVKGYNQAEKDLELAWEDIKKIEVLCFRVDRECDLEEKEYYQEVLKRFKEMKEK